MNFSKNKILSTILLLLFLTFPTTSTAQFDPEIETIISKMTLRQKFAQMMMPAVRTWESDKKIENFQTINPQAQEIFNAYQFGGIILFASNIKTIPQIINLTSALQKSAIENKYPPLFIAIDQEGGAISRLPFGPRMIGNMALGAIDDTQTSYEYGQIIAQEISLLGFNINFAPVSDINNNPENPVIGLRSFSSDPEIVSAQSLAVLEGLESKNIIGVPKHFPGHGDVSIDSHVGLPVINKTINQLLKCELIPYLKLSKEGDLIMTAHIANPKIDPSLIISSNNVLLTRPATFSSATISILKDRLSYEGLIISDALDMGAIANNFDNTYAVIEVFKAGIDIALVPIDLKSPQDKLKLETLFEGLENAVKTGDLKQENIDNSVRKILALKKKMKILDPVNYAQSPAQKIAQAQKFYNDPKIFIAQREMAQKAVTLIKNNGKILPIKTDLPPKILILSPNAKANDALKLAVNQLVGEGVINKKTFFDILDYSLLQNLKSLNWQALFKDYDYIIAVSNISNFSNVKNLWQVKTIRNVIDAANSTDKKLVLISAGLTYDTAYYTKAPAILACFGMQPSMPNIQASMDIIFGLQKPMGKLPIDIPQADPNTLLFKNKILYKIKHGLSF